jgi:hypothetical protein
MAYQNNRGGQGQGGGYQKSDATTSGGPGGSGTGARKNVNRVFSAFKNKSGKGYSVMLDEAVNIPAGTRLGLFLDTITSKKTGQLYEIVNVSVMPERRK